MFSRPERKKEKKYTKKHNLNSGPSHLEGQEDRQGREDHLKFVWK